MNILNNKNKRTSIFKALALCLFAAVSLTLASCDDDMDIQQSYPFTVETMPVPNKVTKGQTVEIRCELKRTGDFANTLYTIRYFQFEGEGMSPAHVWMMFLRVPAFKILRTANRPLERRQAVDCRLPVRPLLTAVPCGHGTDRQKRTEDRHEYTHHRVRGLKLPMGITEITPSSFTFRLLKSNSNS